MRLRPDYKTILVLSTLVGSLLIFPSHVVHAGVLADASFAAASALVSNILQIMFGALGYLTAILAKGLSYAIVLRAGGSIPVVAATWKILRDFSNMMFVVILIYMAFATIFDQGKYKFQSLIVRFIIVAVLINFSLVIGNLVIDACQVLTNVFLGSIGNLGDRFGQFLNPSLLLPGGVGAKIDASTSFLVTAVFSLVLAAIYFFSMLVAFIFAIVRIPIIWGLLIVSPIAWMANILPGTQKRWGEWWGQFIGWNLFLPIYLFFVYLGLIFLSKQQEIISAVIQANPTGTNPLNAPLLGGLTNSLTFSLLFFYLFAAFILVGGVWAARAATSQFGHGFEKGLGWARTAAGRVTGYDIRAAAVKSAANAKLGEFQQKGFDNKFLNKVYGGKEGDQRIMGRYAERFGVRNAAENRLSKDIAGEKSRIQDKDTRELQAVLANPSEPVRRQLAARELLKERNQLTGSQIIETYEMYARDNPQSGLKFANTVDYGKLSKDERGMLYGRIQNVELKKKISGTMAEKGDLDTEEKLKSASTLFVPPGEKDEFLKKAQKKNLLAATRTRVQLGLVKDKDGNIKSLEDALFDQVNGMQAKDIVDLNKSDLTNEDFNRALVKKLEQLQKAQPAKPNKKGNIMPGGGDNFKNNMRKAAAGDQSKLEIIERISFTSETDARENEEEDETPPTAPTPGGTPPPAGGGTTVSFNGKPINRANVIDLRNKADTEIK